jgi:hypothetical protein
MKRISSIGFEIPGHTDHYIQLNSFSSLSDTDIAIFSPDFHYEHYGYSTTETYEGKNLYSKDSSAKILEHRRHWNLELLNFLEHGGTLIIMLRGKKNFFVYTGEKTLSGTGRNTRTTNHVTDYSNYYFLPDFGITYYAESGKTIVPNDPIISELYKDFKESMSFETYITSDLNLPQTFTSKNKDRILGTRLSFKKGFVFFIPIIDFEDETFTKVNPKTDETEWTGKGEKVGKSFLSKVSEIDKAVRKQNESTPAPSWVQNDSYDLKEAKLTITKIAKNKAEIERKTKENERLLQQLEDQESLKDLLFETGKKLESAVTKALRIIGFTAENYDDGKLELDQIIISPEGQRFIGECEGKDSKDIDVSKFRQLLDGLNADFERETTIEKAHGILFGNPQRLVNPDDRSLDFTEKCKSGAKREKIALIRTADLFKICRHIEENNDKKFSEKCRDAIISQLGEIVNFPRISIDEL